MRLCVCVRTTKHLPAFSFGKSQSTDDGRSSERGIAPNEGRVSTSNAPTRDSQETGFECAAEELDFTVLKVACSPRKQGCHRRYVAVPKERRFRHQHRRCDRPNPSPEGSSAVRNHNPHEFDSRLGDQDATTNVACSRGISTKRILLSLLWYTVGKEFQRRHIERVFQIFVRKSKKRRSI